MAQEIISSVTNFSGGIVGGISPYKRRVNYFLVADNVVLRPFGACAVRKGNQRLSSATLTKKPHSVMEWVTSGGTGHAFVGCADTTGVLYEATSGAFTSQSLPFTLGPDVKMVADQLNGALFVTENTGANPPMFYRASNPSNTFHTGILPRPCFMDIPSGTSVTVVSGASTLPGGTVTVGAVVRGATTLVLSNNAGTASALCTLQIGGVKVPNCFLTNGSPNVDYRGAAGAAASNPFTITLAAGGNMQVGQQPWYRLRYRYLDGSSRETAAFQAGAPTAGANLQYNFTNIANEIRSDYLGWTLERTIQGGTVNGPFYVVSDGTGTTYTDGAADADLGARSSAQTNKGEIHGEPPHFAGLLAFKNRLVAWEGSNVWFSQGIADARENTGICNWNPLTALGVGRDDGEPIMCVVKQVDRLIVLKRWSTWVIEGDDITNFRVFPLPGGAGCSGPRAACAIGSVVYFYGDAGFHRLTGNTIEAFGWEQVGHIFDTFQRGQSGDVVVRNYLGQYVLIFFSSGAPYNDDCLAYDQRFGGWTRFRGWYVADFVMQKAGTFGDAQTALTVDRRDLDPGGGFDYPVWMNFYGYQDEKAANGTGGTPPTVNLQTPMIDDGQPQTDKDWEWIQVYLSGGGVTANVALALDPGGSAAVTVAALPGGALWDAPTWDNFKWGAPVDSGPFTGLPAGTIGRRYALGLVCKPTADMTFGGYTMTGTLLPTQDYTPAS